MLGETTGNSKRTAEPLKLTRSPSPPRLKKRGLGQELALLTLRNQEWLVSAERRGGVTNSAQGQS
jgi:hypothetical protein